MRKVMIALLALGAATGPALAQQSSSQPGVTQRVDRLEREMRAVQRKVFPGGGNQQYFEPDIAPQAQAGPVGVPATQPIDDLTSRVGALERELQRLTAQIEQQGFRLRQLEEAQTRLKDDTDTRLRALEGNPLPPPASSAAATPPPAPRPAPAASAPVSSASASPPPPAPASGAPSTGDPGEDAYLVGYRLWVDHKYDDAVTALRGVVQRYPDHRRASYAQNLMGRALLDGGHPAQAAEAFYANYQKMPRGERAPDSLYYLGQSLMALRPPKPADACKVYAELLDVYGTTVNGDLKDKVAQGQTAARCTAAR